LLTALSLSVASPVLADGAVKSRSQSDPRYQWRIEDIYASTAAWQKDWKEVKSETKALAKYEGKLLSSPQTLLAFLEAYEGSSVKLSRLFEYAQRGSDQDTSVSAFNALVGKSEYLAKDVGAATAFVSPEVAKMSEKKLARFLATEPKLKNYRQFLANVIRQGRHTLPKEQEALLAQSGEVMGVPENAFGKLADTDLKFPTIKDEKGQNTELSEGRYISLLESDKREVRRNAYVGLLSTYGSVNNTMAALLNGEVKAHVFNRTVRKYPSAMAAALDNENIPTKVYDSLVSAVNEGLPALHRYYALRKKVLNLPDQRPYDWSVALVPGSKMEFPYEEGKKIINAALAPLGKEYLKVLNKGFDSRWVDVYENKGKRTGAYSASIYGIHPFVLQSYSNTYWDLSTLAHEMGHAVNGYFSQTSNNFFNADNPIFVAEVASQTNEILLMDYMLEKTTDKKQKLFLLCQYADGIIGSIYRQTQYAEFEKAIHRKADGGETLTVDFLNGTWNSILKKYAGPANTLEPESRFGWSRIPHFYYNFYVYKYSTSYAAALAMAEKIEKEGQPAAQKYIRFLKAGSSEYPVQLLQEAGIDLTTPQPVKITVAKFGEIVNQIDALSKEIQAGR
jgi:oligoendopeptidase F